MSWVVWQVRVVKTAVQTADTDVSYVSAVAGIIATDGLSGLVPAHTLEPSPCTLYHPVTLYHILCTVHRAPTQALEPCTLHPASCSLCLALCTAYPRKRSNLALVMPSLLRR